MGNVSVVTWISLFSLEINGTTFITFEVMATNFPEGIINISISHLTEVVASVWYNSVPQLCD